MLLYFWFFLVFVFGLVVGSFLNVCVARLPLEKSLLWPGSRCGHCYQRIRWYDNLPLLGYLILRGRCRTCKAPFSPRYLLIELFTALGFVGLFYVEVVLNVHNLPPRGGAWAIANGIFPWEWWVVFGYHAVLFSFLLVAAACDLNGREIPLSLTLTGTLIGLIGATLMPWPWPDTWADALQRLGPQRAQEIQQQAWWLLGFPVPTGAYPWPVWGPLPEWLPPGSWQLGLATGLAGALVGTLMLRAVGWLFSAGLGKEALGMGDADLMMMAGAFLGWQIVVVAFFVSVIPALVFGVVQVIVHRDNSLPFGPSLAAGTLMTMLLWKVYFAERVQPLFFWGALMLGLAVVSAAFMLGASFLMRLMRGAEPPAGETTP